MLNALADSVDKTVCVSKTVVETGVVKMRSFWAEIVSAAASHPLPSDLLVYDPSYDDDDSQYFIQTFF